MKNLFLLLAGLILLSPALAYAHVGSPDVFYDGQAGPWPTHITIRMPAVVPGQAEIVVQVQSAEPVSVSFVPLFSRIAISNAPPPELAQAVPGETNLYSGTMWLMAMGAYSIEVRVQGKSGNGVVQIPVNSVATAQLPMPRALGGILLVLGLILFCGAAAIVGAAASESRLAPEVFPGKIERRKYWIAASVTVVVLALALVGGKKWWDVEENRFRARLHEGGWPDLTSGVRVEGSQRILQLTLGKKDFGPKANLALAPDHGKLLHLFLIRQPNHEAFGHLHPVRRDNNVFDVALPPLPEGDYELFCDLTLESGLSSTATNYVQLPAAPSSAGAHSVSVQADLDDSWSTNATMAVRDNPRGDTICRLADGTQVIWKMHPPLRAKQNAGLRFEVLDAAGKPAVLQSYMGMMSHAAVMRTDGRVFAHLHPSGNFSMAAQMFFDKKLNHETGHASTDGGMPDMPGMDMSMMMDHSMMSGLNAVPTNGEITLPYEFPTPGEYRIWVQVKIEGQVRTAIFDTTVK